MEKIKTVGIVGCGVMGSAIGLSAAASGYDVVFKIREKREPAAVFDEKVTRVLIKKVEKNRMTREEMERITRNIKITNHYEDLQDCELVIESVVETLESKTGIFRELAKTCSEETLFVSNTSTFLIKEVMENVPHPERTAGLHYFFPANINPLVEIIRHDDTSLETFMTLREFAVNSGKTVVEVKDFPGFAINPVFIATYMLTDSFYGKYNTASLDSISREALGLKYGMMWVQNGTGISTCYHAAESMHRRFCPTDIGFVEMPESLKDCFRNKRHWDLSDGPVIEDKHIRGVVIDRLLGTIFTLCSHLIEKQIISLTDLEKGIRYSLAWPKGPFSMMNEMGMEKTRQLIVQSCFAGPFNMPDHFLQKTPSPWVLA
ncbi:MAG: 3-hydroxyacyl-CoA dehydrogenase NAD-binding domain-containing protein [Desulfobacula sp.]|jgi:3-hydroxyacyl-CoA dehydrogenase